METMTIVIKTVRHGCTLYKLDLPAIVVLLLVVDTHAYTLLVAHS